MTEKNLPQIKIDKQKTTIEVPHKSLLKFIRIIFRLILPWFLSGSTVSLPPEHLPANPPIDQPH
jgi:hypothetical protein